MGSACHTIGGSYPAIHAIGDPSRLAVVVVDMQAVFVDEGQSLASDFARGIVPNIGRLIAAVRASGGTIAWTRQTWADDGVDATPRWFNDIIGEKSVIGLQRLKPGQPEHEVSHGFIVEAGDIVVDKYRPSAFLPETTGLHAALQARGIDTLIVVGVLTNYCCQSTARDAMNLDYRVFFVPDATACASDAFHNATLDDLANMGFFDLRTTAQLIAAIG